MALHRVLYQSILNAKLTGRKTLDRKRCISNRDDRKLENSANAVSSAGVGTLCFLKSTVNPAIYQDILEHVMLPSADKLYGDAGFIFQQDLI